MTRVTEIDHPSHGHPLILESPNEPYNCDGCKELGFGPCYHCKFGCDFHIHHECAVALNSSATHPFFKGCKFVFRKEAHNRYCDACGNDVLGFLYQCQHEKAHDLHPCCLKLQRNIVSSDGVRLRLTHRVSSKCLKCGSKEASNGIRGWSYESNCGRFCYHVACVKDLVLENFRNSFDGQRSHGSVLSEASDYLALPISTSSALARTSNVSTGRAKFWKMAKMVLKVIISAIFGDPSAGIVFLIESLIS